MSKIEQERLLLELHEREGLEVVLLNPSILYGPGDVYRSSTDDIRLFLARQIPNVPSGGLNFVDARDAARTFVSALRSGRSGERYLLGGHNMRVGEFFALLERVSGIAAPRLRLPEALARGGALLMRTLARARGTVFPVDDISVRMAYHYWYCDSQRAREELGHTARPAEETLRDTVGFIRGETDG
jgi:dihydroflavonol-4-reductase